MAAPPPVTPVDVVAGTPEHLIEVAESIEPPIEMDIVVESAAMPRSPLARSLGGIPGIV